MRRNWLRDVLANPLLIPVVIVLAAGAGFALAKAMNFTAHGQQLRAATVIVMIASALGLLPSWLLRKSEPGTLATASFAGTVVHMFATIAMGGFWWMSRNVLDRPPFLNWLLVMYWVSIVALATVMITMVRARAPERAKSIASPARPAPAGVAPAPAQKTGAPKPPARVTPPRPGAARPTPPPPPRRTN